MPTTKALHRFFAFMSLLFFIVAISGCSETKHSRRSSSESRATVSDCSRTKRPTIYFSSTDPGVQYPITCCSGKQCKHNFQDEIASTHMSVLSVIRFEEYAKELQPSFDVKPDKAVEMAAPVTYAAHEVIAEKDKVTIRLAGGYDVKSGIPNAAADGPAKASPDGAPAIPPPAVADDSLKSQAPVDAMTRYQLASAIYQEIKLLNKEVTSAAMRDGYDPYVVRLQTSVMQSKTEIDRPYFIDSLYTFTVGDYIDRMPIALYEDKGSILASGGENVTVAIAKNKSFYSSKENKRLTFVNESTIIDGKIAPKSIVANKSDGLYITVTPTSTDKVPFTNNTSYSPTMFDNVTGRLVKKIDNSPGKSIQPVVVPLLVSDNMEAALLKSDNYYNRQLLFSLAAAVKYFSGEGTYENTLNELMSKQGRHLNSLFSVSRVNDNVLRSRIGTYMATDDGGYFLPTGNHYVTLLLLVPKGSKDINILSRNDILDGKSGDMLDDRYDDDVEMRRLVNELLDHYSVHVNMAGYAYNNLSSIKTDVFKDNYEGTTRYNDYMSLLNNLSDAGAGYNINSACVDTLLKESAKFLRCSNKEEAMKALMVIEHFRKRHEKKTMFYTAFKILYEYTLSGNYSGFESAFNGNGLCGSDLPKELLEGIGHNGRHIPSLWNDISSLRVGSKYHMATLELPKPKPASLPPAQAVLLKDNGDSAMEAKLNGGKNLRADKLSASLILKVDSKEIQLVPEEAIKVDNSGSNPTIKLPSLMGWRLQNVHEEKVVELTGSKLIIRFNNTSTVCNDVYHTYNRKSEGDAFVPHGLVGKDGKIIMDADGNGSVPFTIINKTDGELKVNMGVTYAKVALGTTGLSPVKDVLPEVYEITLKIDEKKPINLKLTDMSEKADVTIKLWTSSQKEEAAKSFVYKPVPKGAAPPKKQTPEGGDKAGGTTGIAATTQ